MYILFCFAILTMLAIALIIEYIPNSMVQLTLRPIPVQILGNESQSYYIRNLSYDLDYQENETISTTLLIIIFFVDHLKLFFIISTI